MKGGKEKPRFFDDKGGNYFLATIKEELAFTKKTSTASYHVIIYFS